MTIQQSLQRLRILAAMGLAYDDMPQISNSSSYWQFLMVKNHQSRSQRREPGHKVVRRVPGGRNRG